MKKILIAALISIGTLLSGCGSVKVNEDKPVKAELYIIHSKLTSYNTFPDSTRRIWSEKETIDDVLKTFPEGANPVIIHKTSLQTSWGKKETLIEKDFLDATKWDIKNMEWISKVTEQPVITSKFIFNLTPKHLEDGRNIALMSYTLEFLREIEKAESKELYFANTDLFRDAKESLFLTDHFYVFGALALKNKESLILVYKITND